MTEEARRAAAAIDSCICALYHRAVMLAWPPSSGQGGRLWPAARVKVLEAQFLGKGQLVDVEGQQIDRLLLVRWSMRDDAPFEP